MTDARLQTRALLRDMSSARLVTIAENPVCRDDMSARIAARLLRARGVWR